MQRLKGPRPFPLVLHRYTFRPQVTYQTIGLDDAEALMAKKDTRSQRLGRLKVKEGEGEEDDERARQAARDADEERAFDDGAGPDWAADEMRHEDGNDGQYEPPRARVWCPSDSGAAPQRPSVRAPRRSRIAANDPSASLQHPSVIPQPST